MKAKGDYGSLVRKEIKSILNRIVRALLSGFVLCGPLHSIDVTNANDAGPGSLREALTNVTNGGEIVFKIPGLNPTIPLQSSLPAIRYNISMFNDPAFTEPVTIDGQNAHQAFSFAEGSSTLSLPSLSKITNCYSKGGKGGDAQTLLSSEGISCCAGGGGAAAGGALYIHAGAHVIVQNVQLITNGAIGGSGGSVKTGATYYAGGGGGGFSGGDGGGGGGGGHNGGGAGGGDPINGEDGKGLGGGGGGGTAGLGGNAMDHTGGTYDGTYGVGGGGAGPGGNGGNGAEGGNGGIGIGVDKLFGGGGGGASAALGKAGGIGYGSGGGATGPSGSSGGQFGGGGGGADNFLSQPGGAGGAGGAGGGGGGGNPKGTGGVVKSGLAGGSGGSVTPGSWFSAGGGGAGFGGAIFVGSGASLTLGGATLVSGNTAAGGVKGTCDPALSPQPQQDGQGGDSLSDDIFVMTGGSLFFHLDANLEIKSTIDSDEGYMGGTCGTNPGLTMQGGTGVLFLNPINPHPGAQPINTYSCGTTVSGGVLRVEKNTSLGRLSDGIVLSTGGTLRFTGTDTVPRSITLSGGDGGIEVPNPNTLILSGIIDGSGVLSKQGDGTLILTHANSYTGGTKILGGGTLQGDMEKVKGNISFGSTADHLIVPQNQDGVLAGILTGPGIFTKRGPGVLHVPMSNPGFNGTVKIEEGEFNITGSLSEAQSTTVGIGTILSGTGIIGSTASALTNGGTIRPGNSIGTLTIHGSLFMQPSTLFEVEVAPTTHDLLVVTDNATLDGTLHVNFFVDQGFLGFSNVIPILVAGARIGEFSTIVNGTATPENFFPIQVVYSPTEVLLLYQIIDPFLYCSLPYRNERAVSRNLTELHILGALSLGSPLWTGFQNLVGQSCDVIANALDSCHPAVYSAFAEFQPVAESAILSFFQRRLTPRCCCLKARRIWAEPFGTWLDQDNRGEQVGFSSDSRGVAAGVDSELSSTLILGVGGVWNHEYLHWKKERGHGRMEGMYGVVYLDYLNEANYVGMTVMGGKDSFDVNRHIPFVGQSTEASFDAPDLAMRLSVVHFFGSSLCALYPYLNVDFFYTKQPSFTEKHLPGFELFVQSNERSTLRSELGVTIQSQDRSARETMCFSPLISGAWVMQNPIQRDVYTARFSDQEIPFEVRGWDHVWQIFLMRFGMDLVYKCFSLSASYSAEMSSGDFFGQKGNVRIEISF